MPRCRYMYRLPCRTEYNSDYYSRDQIKCCTAEITMPYTMQITIPSTMPYLCQSYITENTREYDPSSDSAIPSYTTTMSIDDCKSTSQLSPSNRCSLRSCMRLVAGGATTFNEGDDCTGISNNSYSKQLPSRKYRNDAPYDPVTN
jgi:hypothetical protein